MFGMFKGSYVKASVSTDGTLFVKHCGGDFEAVGVVSDTQSEGVYKWFYTNKGEVLKVRYK